MKLKEVKYRFKYKPSSNPNMPAPEGWQFLDLSLLSEPFEIDENTLSLYTGYHDSDGNEIYFGDIIRNQGFLVVHEGLRGLYLLDCLNKIADPAFKYVVAGNVIDNPELIDIMKL